MLRMIPFLLLLASMLLPTSVGAQQGEGARSYYADRERGWYWREARPEPPPKPKVRRLPPTGVGQGTSDPMVDVPLSSAWFRQHLDRYRDMALDNPTPDNVERYQLLQRYAMDKADRFSEVWTRVTANNPLLDESNERPRTALQKRAVNAQVSAARRALLRSLSDEVGIWYFYRHDCPYCLRQTEPLQSLTQQYGFKLLPISLDGQPMMDGSYPDYVVDDGHAQRLGVTVTPTLYMFRAPSSFEKLSVGLKTTDDIEDLILENARRAGWISEAAYTEATRGIAPTNLVDRMSPDELADDPDALLHALRNMSAGIGGSTPWSGSR